MLYNIKITITRIKQQEAYRWIASRQSPPLPHPWAQSVAPLLVGGKPLRLAGGLLPAPIPVRPPPRGWAPKFNNRRHRARERAGPTAEPPALPRHYGGSKVGRTTALHCLCGVGVPPSALRPSPLLSDVPMQEQWRTEPPSPLQARPPPQGVAVINKCPADYSPLQIPLCPTHIGRSR